MIADSIPWRDELLKVAERLNKRKSQRRWSERTSFLVERDVMVSAYAIRKLNEGRKLSDNLAAQRLIVIRHEPISQAPDIWSRHAIWEHYNLDTGTDVEISLADLCNQFIHSWVWQLSASEGDEFDGVFVSSDRQRGRCLYFVSVDLLINLFRAVGAEDIATIEAQRDANGDTRILRVVARNTD